MKYIIYGGDFKVEILIFCYVVEIARKFTFNNESFDYKLNTLKKNEPQIEIFSDV